MSDSHVEGDVLQPEVEALRQRAAQLEAANAALAQSLAEAQRFQHLTESTADVVYRYRFGSSPGFDYLSSGIATLTGYTPEEYYAHPTLIFRRIHPEDRLIFTTWRRSLLSTHTHLTLRWRRRDGAVIWIEQRLIPVRDSTGRLVAVEGVAHEVTDQKQVEVELHRRIEQLHALYRVSNSLARAIKLEDVYQEALNAVQLALKTDRSSISLLAEDNVVRIKAWRGLSVAYRQMTGTYFPWSPRAIDPQPLLIPNVVDAPELGTLQEVILAEGIRAIGFIPLVQYNRLLGQLMIYFDTVHPFSEDEVQMAKTVAGHIAFALDHKQAEATLAQSNTVIATLTEVGAHLQTSLEFNSILEILGDGLKQLDLMCSLSLIDVKSSEVVLVYYSVDPATAAEAERLLGIQLQGYRLPLNLFVRPSSFNEYSQPVFTSKYLSVGTKAFPNLPLSRLAQALHVVGLSPGQPILCLPLIANNEAIGVVSVWGPSLRKADILSLSIFAAQAGAAIQNARLFDALHNSRWQLEALSHRLVEVQETERRLIARELHDEIGQALTGIRLLLEMVQHSPSTALTNLAEAQILVSDLITQVQNLSLGLRPAMLDDLGLLATLLWHFERYTAQTGIHVRFEHTELNQRFDPLVETAAYRIVQEALTNVARYAGVTEVLVHAWVNDDQLGVRIIDTGCGFDPDSTLAAGHSTGLSGMRERATLLGGRWLVKSAPGAGTQVLAEIPVGAQSQEATRGNSEPDDYDFTG